MTVRRHKVNEIRGELKVTGPSNDKLISFGMTVDDLRKEILSGVEVQLDDQAVQALNEDIDDVYKNIRGHNIRGQIGHSKLRSKKIQNLALTTNEAAIPHSLGVTPEGIQVVPLTNGVWYQSKKPDATCIYLTASAAMTVDIKVEG